MHLKRPRDSCFINSYFVAGVKGFRANVDLQPFFNHKFATSVCSYFEKDETERLQAFLNAAKETKDSNMNIRESFRKTGATFLSTREVSSQKCILYRFMPELWLRTVFPKTILSAHNCQRNESELPKASQNLMH